MTEPREPKEQTDGLRIEYRKRKRQKQLLIGLSFLLTILLMLVFTTFGASDTSFSGVVQAIARTLSTGGEIVDKQDKIIMLLRLPRMAMAVVAGIGLSVSGAAMQAATRNPLVSPFTIGISNAAAFGASLSIVFGVGLFCGSQLGTVFNAFLWALGCMGVVSLIAAKGGMSPSTIVLTGIALNYLFSACTSTIEFFASEHKLAEVVQWAFGSLNGSNWQEVFVMAVVVTACTAAMFFHAPALNIIAGGDDEVAKSLGIHPGKVRFAVCVEAAMATAAVISFTGVIGFVGLAGPHIARIIIGSDHRYLLPFSAAMGALLMLIADTIGRLILAPVMIPVGIVISFLGVPIFVNLILVQRKGSV